jgi:hypothetical protein
MPSAAFRNWMTARAAALHGIEDAYRSIRGGGPGRRTATQQLNHWYAVMLASQFQAFCRDLHTECAEAFVAPVSLPDLRRALLANVVSERKLDSGNANPVNIGRDFNRFALVFWSAVDVDHPRNPRRKVLLEELNGWRNAIAHQSFTPAMLKGGSAVLPLSRVQRWRTACAGLARSFDHVMRAHLLKITGVVPW